VVTGDPLGRSRQADALAPTKGVANALLDWLPSIKIDIPGGGLTELNPLKYFNQAYKEGIDQVELLKARARTCWLPRMRPRLCPVCWESHRLVPERAQAGIRLHRRLLALYMKLDEETQKLIARQSERVAGEISLPTPEGTLKELEAQEKAWRKAHDAQKATLDE